MEWKTYTGQEAPRDGTRILFDSDGVVRAGIVHLENKRIYIKPAYKCKDNKRYSTVQVELKRGMLWTESPREE